MRTIFLIPPSEGKTLGWSERFERLFFHFQKPLTLASQATEKDLKCIGNRYAEGKILNERIGKGPFIKAIDRYDGVMYDAIGYSSMTKKGQSFFEEHFFVMSGMYGMVRPTDTIGNYKLPIETRGLAAYWKRSITAALNELAPDRIINLLPHSYMKMIDWKNLSCKVLLPKFEESPTKDLTHNIKKVRGEWIRKICEDFGEDIRLA